MFALGFPELLIIIAVFGAVVFVVAMFVSMIHNKQLSGSSKIIWALAFIFFQLFTAVYYYTTNYTGKYSLRKASA
jgi:hypothetical protein